MEFSDLYSAKILEIAGSLPPTDELDAPDARARKVSRVCGSRIEVELCVRDGVITEYAHKIEACALGQTSAAIVARNIVGTPASEFRHLRDQMEEMLKKDGPPPEGARWQELKYLQPVRDYPARHTSTMLVFEAVVDCLDQIGAGRN